MGWQAAGGLTAQPPKKWGYHFEKELLV